MGDSGNIEPESKRLKDEIRALRIVNEDLMDEVADLRKELDFCYQTLAFRKPFLQPPSEILHMIFERTIPPHFLVDPSASFSVNSLWCEVQQQKNSIVNVCRTWYTIGLPFLYADISIRRVYQLSNLLRTLKISSPNLDLGQMIRTIGFYCFVPAWYEQQFEQQLKVLFDICPQITSCSFGSALWSFYLPVTAPLCALVPNITDLRLHYDIDPIILENILELASLYLVSLSFRIPEDISTSTPIPPRHFMHLECLTIWVTSQYAAASVEALSSVWQIPHLKRLTIQGDLPPDALQSLCDTYGTGLQYLHITARTDSAWTWFLWATIPLPDLSVSCPVLEHIVLSPKLSGPFEHKCIKWIDIWTSAESTRDVEASRRKIEKWKLPALKGVRILPYDLHELPLTLPFLLSPTLISNPLESLSFQFRDVVIRHDIGELSYIQSGWAGNAGEESSEDSSDESFIPDESGSSSESNWEAGSDDHISTGGDAEMDALETDLW